MTALFYFSLAVVLVLAWWAWPAADDAQIRMVYKPDHTRRDELIAESNDRLERLRIVLKSDDVGQDWMRSLKDHPVTLLPAIPGHQHKIGSDGWPVCGCQYQFPQDADRLERLRKVMQAQERKR